MLTLDDTITALASPPGPGARGIVRLSGAGSAGIVGQCFEAETDWRSSRVPRRTEGFLKLPVLTVPLPAAMHYWPTIRSFTGQPMIELHLIGSPPLLDATIEALCRYGARLARRGEFTLRAFLSGRIDLLQAEAVLGVIEAADHHELSRALGQLGGAVTSRIAAVRSDLIALLGDLEAGLDFVDEDIEFVSRDEIARRLCSATASLEELNTDAAQRLPSGHRRRVVIAGLPNAGKSTLFNRLAGEQRAIVSPLAGTTRDYVSATIRMDGLEIELIDTAGWEVSGDAIMRRAQELRGEQFSAADLIVWCTAADLDRNDEQHDRQRRAVAESTGVVVLSVLSCIDRGGSTASFSTAEDREQLRVSVLTGDGFDSLQQAVIERLQRTGAARGELLGTSVVRCRDSLQRTVTSLRNAQNAVAECRGDEILAADLREALNELATVVGAVYTDDILDHIFSRFCIGK